MLQKQKITPCLWFNANAEEAVNFYTTVFKNSKINQVSYYGDSGSKISGLGKGKVLAMTFEIDGQSFTALNGGVDIPYTPAISFLVNCDGQEEIDYYWQRLSEDGTTEKCGWLKDRFGISWQVVPSELGDLMTKSNNKEKVMQEMLKMKKLDIAVLKKAGE
ncbi:MAG TPA: VOC family protein [Cytophagaceae bacterium]